MKGLFANLAIPKLRDYQLDAIAKLDVQTRVGKAAMLSLATGGGKTAIAAGWSQSQAGLGLFVAPTLSVVEQAPFELGKWQLNAVSIGSGIEGGTGKSAWQTALKSDRDMICASYISAQNNARVSQFGHLIVDEAHHAVAGTRVAELVKSFKRSGIPVIGITATPWRLNKTEGFEDVWDVLVEGVQWQELAERGYLASPLVYPSDIVTPGAAKVIGAGEVGGDYSTGATDRRNAENPTYIELVAVKLVEYALQNKRVICYATSINHAKQIAVAAVSRGLMVGLLASDKLDDIASTDIITDPVIVREGLRNGSLLAVVNVNMITEGYDCPDVDAIIIVRPTQSYALWMQMCGRGSRLAEGKTSVDIIDLTDNVERLGHPYVKKAFSLEPRGEQSGELPPLAKCPYCEVYLPPGGWHNCPSCGEALYIECPKCRNMRHWTRFDRDKPGARCSFCIEESARVNADLIQIDRINLRYTKKQVPYFYLASRGRFKANVFSSQKELFAEIAERFEYGRFDLYSPGLFVVLAPQSATSKWLKVVQHHWQDTGADARRYAELGNALQPDKKRRL